MKTTISGARAGRKNERADFREFTEKSVGFVGDSTPCCEPGNEAGEAAPAAWMTPNLIERTHTVWSKRYGRSLEQWEVVEILRNVRWFGEILRRWMKGGLTT